MCRGGIRRLGNAACITCMRARCSESARVRVGRLRATFVATTRSFFREKRRAKNDKDVAWEANVGAQVRPQCAQ